MSISVKKSGKASGILFLLAGLAFLGAAVAGRQAAFGGIAVMFLALGSASLMRARKADAR